MQSTKRSDSGKPVSAATAKLRLLKSLRCTLRYEKKAWDTGASAVAGVDEVGRGSLFGPVVAAAVILDPGYRIRGLRDSKLLPAERREVLAERIREHSIAWAIAAADAACIDQINIYQASRVAMRDAVSQLVPACDYLLVDALSPRLRGPAAGADSWRRALCFDRGGIDCRQGRTRSHDGRVGRGVPGIRPRLQQGLQRSASYCRVARARPIAPPPPVLCPRLERANSPGSFEFMLDEVEPEADVDFVETGTSDYVYVTSFCISYQRT